MKVLNITYASLFLDPNGIFSPAGHKNEVRAQRGLSVAKEFFSAEKLGATVVYRMGSKIKSL